MNPKRILIVGGGSSGWMAAAYLHAALNRSEKVAEITLVESPDVPRVGVGEATVPNINHILSVIGIDELEFMRQVDGTFKQSIKYVNWLDGQGEHYHHPFSRYRMAPLDRSSHMWLRSDRSIPFMETVSAQPIICELGLSPRMLGEWDFGPPLTYAFHMNALKFADYLTEIATSRGVSHYREHVSEIETTQDGDIAAVKTRSGKRLEADLFIDCTGFAALLIEKTLGVKFLDYSQWLLNDRAVTMHVDYEHHYTGSVRPYTTATALSSGWVWEIPLQNTRSLGYVHSSHFISDEDAEAELRQFEGPHSASLGTRIVPFKVGRREHAWYRNCVAIGLSGGFIEPLESTGLYLSDLATVMLAEHFPHRCEMQPMAIRFNRIMTNRFYEILDFINMHYCLTRRTDTAYWQEVQKSERINERLRAKLEYWKLKPPSAADFQDQFLPGQPDTPLSPGMMEGDYRCPVDTAGLWNHESYEAILFGMDFLRDQCDEYYGKNRPGTMLLKQIVDRLRAAPKKLPPHAVWLQRMVGMRDFPKP